MVCTNLNYTRAHTHAFLTYLFCLQVDCLCRVRARGIAQACCPFLWLVACASDDVNLLSIIVAHTHAAARRARPDRAFVVRVPKTMTYILRRVRAGKGTPKMVFVSKRARAAHCDIVRHRVS